MEPYGPEDHTARPQYDELVEVVRRFLAGLAADPFLILRVSDPATGRRVDVVNHDLHEDELDEEEGIVFAIDGVPVVRTPSWQLEMYFDWAVSPEPEQVAPLALIARRLGFPPPRIRLAELPFTVETYSTVPRACRSVEGLDADAIAWLCLEVHRDVFGREPAHRLQTSVGQE